MSEVPEIAPDEAAEEVERRSRLGGALLRFGYLALLIVLLALSVIVSQRNPTPGETSPEVGFAHDMIVHHAQAVDMATIL
jgi:hypothetical protein